MTFFPLTEIASFFSSRYKKLYRFGFQLLNGGTHFNNYSSERQKLSMVLENPAVMKVFALQCDLFSMGKVCIQDPEGEEIEQDPFLDLLRAPNPFTNTESQFLWDFMFWNMLGTSYCYVDSKLPERKGNKMYFLDPSKIKWPEEFEKRRDKLIFSDAEITAIKKSVITYKYDDGTVLTFPFDRLVISFDLTNSVGNFFKGPSRLDALYKVISNAEYVLDAENINIRYSGKFLVGSDKQVSGQVKLGMSATEKNDIRTKIDDSDQAVWPFESMVKIQRFVSDLASLQLPQEYLHQYFLIGSMYGIPRDVLEAYNSATYENQEKARAAHVNYCLEPKGEQFMDAFEVHFGYRPTKNIKISWKHLPFVQVFAKEKADTKKVTIEALTSLLALGVSIDQANEFLETEFKIEKPATTGQNGQAQSGQGGAQTQPAAEEESAADAGDNQEVDAEV